MDLVREEKNARCCTQKLDCCKKNLEPTNFEVRALLLKCNQHPTNHTISTCSGACSKRNVKEVKYARSVNEDYQIINCKKKIKLTVKIKNSGMTNCKNQYILIDHVFDEITGRKQKLLYPYVIRFKQQPIMQIYGMNFESMVNAQAKEKIFNKADDGEYWNNVK